jgi:hypothetical protein
MMQEEENIQFFLSDSDNYESNNNEMQQFFDEFFLQQQHLQEEKDMNYSLLVDYSENYTVKQLLKICDYYDIPKKTKKVDIINDIMVFENNPENKQMVLKRKQMWFYIAELKNDKKMRVYVFNF